MSPYRVPPPERPPRREDRHDDRAVSIVLAACGAIPVVVALVTGQRFGAEATLGVGLLLVGLAGAR